MRSNRLKRGSAILALLIVATGSLVTSCKKKDDTKPQGMVAPVPNYPKFTDADATLVAVKSAAPFPANLPIPEIPGMPSGGLDLELNFGMGIAVFKGNVKADKVLLAEQELKFTNGVHTWLPDFSNLTNPANATGINLNGSFTWKITNPTIEKALSGMPTIPKISSATTVQKSGDYTITHNAVSGATKILYSITDGKGKQLEKEQNGNSTSCVFTAAELSALSSSKYGLIQASAYTVTNETISGKKVYFVRLSAYTISTAEIK